MRESLSPLQKAKARAYPVLLMDVYSSQQKEKIASFFAGQELDTKSPHAITKGIQHCLDLLDGKGKTSAQNKAVSEKQRLQAQLDAKIGHLAELKGLLVEADQAKKLSDKAKKEEMGSTPDAGEGQARKEALELLQDLRAAIESAGLASS